MDTKAHRTGNSSGTDVMHLQHRNGLNYYQFKHLSKYSDIWHGIFTRKDGYSKGAYSSLNTSYGVGDDALDVAQNRNAIAACVGGGDVVFPKQIHGDGVVTISDRDHGATDMASPATIVADALISDISQQYLVIQVADCQSILLYDPDKRVVANIHCGWRGSIQNIAGRTLKKMQQTYGTLPQNIIAGIGPSLGPCCAEFIHYRREIPERYWSYKSDTNHFDFWSLTQDQLCEEGVPVENIASSQVCTKCHPEWFYSYRGEGRTGRFSVVIGIR